MRRIVLLVSGLVLIVMFVTLTNNHLSAPKSPEQGNKALRIALMSPRLFEEGHNADEIEALNKISTLQIQLQLLNSTTPEAVANCDLLQVDLIGNYNEYQKGYYDLRTLVDADKKQYPNLARILSGRMAQELSAKGPVYILALPTFMPVRSVYYREDIFKKYSIQTPRRIDDFFTINDKLKAQGKHSLIAANFGSGSSRWRDFQFVFRAYGADYGLNCFDRFLNDDNRAGGAPEVSDNSLDALLVINRMFHEGVIAPESLASNGLWNATNLANNALVVTSRIGEVAKIVQDTDDHAVYAASIAITNEKVNGLSASPLSNIMYMAIPKTSANPLGALSFLEMACNPRKQYELFRLYNARTVGGIFSNEHGYDDWENLHFKSDNITALEQRQLDFASRMQLWSLLTATDISETRAIVKVFWRVLYDQTLMEKVKQLGKIRDQYYQLIIQAGDESQAQTYWSMYINEWKAAGGNEVYELINEQ